MVTLVCEKCGRSYGVMPAEVKLYKHCLTCKGFLRVQRGA